MTEDTEKGPVKKCKHTKEDVTEPEIDYSLSSGWPFFMLAIGLLMFYGIYKLDEQLPTVVTEYEAEQDNSLFSGERSKNFLARLTSMGPRIVGTKENEILAADIIINELKAIQNKTDAAQSLTYKVQKGTGAYTLEYHPRFTNVYVDIQNIIAKLEGTHDDHSILLNCHFDSVPTSDGAADDAITCSVMMELIRVLTKSPKRLKHSLVFLFNGAEETALQGSHLFLKHEWAKNCRTFINMESAGLGGKSMLFQAGPNHAWLVNYYTKTAPHPHGQIIGEELFQTGLLPSDTDFRIFRDFGNMPGLDFAYYHNGFVYHTIYDAEIYIPAGCHQHLGDNVLALIRPLGNAPEIEHMEERSDNRTVYYDFLGKYMVAYPEDVGVKINYAVFGLSMLSIVVFLARMSFWTCNGDIIEQRGCGFAIVEVFFAIMARLAGTMLGMATCLLVGYLIDSFAILTMPWYSSSWLVFPIFWCPCLAASGFMTILVGRCREDNRGIPLNLVTQMNMVAAQIPFALIMLGLTFAGYRTASLFMVSVLSSAVANLLINLTPLYRTVHMYVYVYLLIHLPNILYQMSIVLILYVFLIPIMGRSGTINGDLRMAALSALLSLFMFTFAIPLMTLVKRSEGVSILLLLLAFGTGFLSITTSIGQPYRGGDIEPAPQRYWIMHSDRQFFNESQLLRRRETGYFVLNLDRNSPRTIPLGNRNISYLAEDCVNELYCGLPLYLGRMVPWSAESSWIPAGAPELPTPTTMSVNRTCTPSPVVCTLDFLFNGPDRLTVTFAPREGVTVKNWSLPTEPKASGEWKGRPSYFIHIVRDRNTDDFPFTLELNVPSERTFPIVDLGLAGNHIHHEDQRTMEFESFIEDFPSWVQLTGWISSYSGYIF